MRTVRLPPACQAVPEAHINTARNRRSFLLTSCSCAWALVHAELPERARAAGPPEQENVPALYDAFAQQYDTLDDGAAASLFGFPTLRQRMLSSANGRVLECGGGTGVPPASLRYIAMTESLSFHLVTYSAVASPLWCSCAGHASDLVASSPNCLFVYGV